MKENITTVEEDADRKVFTHHLVQHLNFFTSALWKISCKALGLRTRVRIKASWSSFGSWLGVRVENQQEIDPVFRNEAYFWVIEFVNKQNYRTWDYREAIATRKKNCLACSVVWRSDWLVLFRNYLR